MPVLGLERDASVKITTCCVSLVTWIQILGTWSSSTGSVGPISDPNPTFSGIYLHSCTCTQTFKNIVRTPASYTRSLVFFFPLAFWRQSHLAQSDLTIYLRMILNCWSSCLCVPEYWDYGFAPSHLLCEPYKRSNKSCLTNCFFGTFWDQPPA